MPMDTLHLSLCGTVSWLAIALALMRIRVDRAAPPISSRTKPAIATPRAQVRSGPGEKFYPTDTLTSGETVEVYREEADGWLAIRPPERSFSLVLERQLKLRDDGLAEVDERASHRASAAASATNAMPFRYNSKRAKSSRSSTSRGMTARRGARSPRRPASFVGFTRRACSESAR